MSRPLCTAKGSLFSCQLGKIWSAKPWPHFPYSGNFIGRILLKVYLFQGVFSECWFSLQLLLRKSLIPPFRALLRRNLCFQMFQNGFENEAITENRVILEDNPGSRAGIVCRGWSWRKLRNTAQVHFLSSFSCTAWSILRSDKGRLWQVSLNSTGLETIYLCDGTCQTCSNQRRHQSVPWFWVGHSPSNRACSCSTSHSSRAARCLPGDVLGDNTLQRQGDSWEHLQTSASGLLCHRHLK